MKFKDKNGCIFIPTNPKTIEEMKKSDNYEEIKKQKEENKETKKK